MDQVRQAKNSNPIGLNGISFVEFCGETPEFYADLFGKMGMVLVGRSAGNDKSLYQQGDIRFLVSHAEAQHSVLFAEAHGPCISGLGYRVKDVGQAFDWALRNGWTQHSMTDGQKAVSVPTLTGIGGSGLYLVQCDQEEKVFEQAFPTMYQLTEEAYRGASLHEVDHLTHNVRQGEREKWVNLYRDSFNFTVVFELDATGIFSGMQTTAVLSPCGKFRIAINEPTEAKSQIQEFIDEMKGEGIQHIALSSHDLYKSIAALRGAEIPFQEASSSYYDMLDDRLPGHGENTGWLRELGILLDGEPLEGDNPKWGLLLQLFSKNLIGPVFFEFIQRKQNEGFGEGNAQALFESIERDQLQRGSVSSN